MVRIRDLACGYSDKTVLTNLNADLEPGSLLFLLGPNGSGKTTLVKTLAGVLSPLSGIITTASKPVWLPASPTPHEALTGHDLLDLYLARHSKRNFHEVVESLQVGGLLPRPLGTLSSGEQRRIYLAAVLSHPSDFVVLDEPLNFLDWSNTLSLVPLIQAQRSLGRIFIIATHDLSWALRFENSTSFVLKDNRIAVTGKTTDVLSSPEFQSTFGFKTKVLDNPLDNSKILAMTPAK